MTRGDARIRPDSRLTAAEVAEHESSGAWRRRSLRALLRDAAQRHPERVAAVGYRAGSLDAASAVTYAELDALASGLAAGLGQLGVGPGDVVAVMLPNRVEFGALIFAINEAGATYTGIPAGYGAREVRQILGQSEAKVVVVQDGAALEIVRGLREGLPALAHVVVLGGAAAARERRYESLLAAGAEPHDDFASVAHVGFTSGTSGAPKGVMNTAQTLEAVLRNWVAHVGGPGTLGHPVVNLIASPVGHHTGFCWGVLLSAQLGGTAVYLDRWDPAVGARIMREQRVTTMFSAPTFVQDLVAAGDPGVRERGALRMIAIAGAPIPRSLPAVAGEALGCTVCPAWGMTEYAIALSWAPALGGAAQLTDGAPVPGAEIRVVSDARALARPGEVGHLQVRGAGLFIGYHRRPEANAEAFDGGWFRTGDTATVTPEGLVMLVGRSKDIVIRGGENIPVAEIESLLFDHPKVRDLAIIGVPDERLGQRACAVVVPSSGGPPTLDELCAHLLAQGVSRRFLPERLELVPSLPKTASGKIRKVELREAFA